MKQRILIKIGLTAVCIQITVCHLTAALVDSLARAEVATAIALASGATGKIDRPKAFEILKRHAEAGNPRAMNGLGIMYIQGHVSAPDTALAVYWLTEAGENDFAPAWNNLGIIYKYAHGGIQQSMERTYYYFDKAVQTGHPAGYYNAGYMLYKGLGCEQDYEKAFAYFEKGAERDYAPAMYMLGLCYRNGYGTARSDGDAHFWLAEADRKAYRFATDEIEAETPENNINRTQLKSAQTMDIPLQFAKVKHLDPGIDINGFYEGLLISYDWSGKNIIRETPIRLNLVSNGKSVEGEWMEAGDTVSLKAEQEAGSLRFVDTRQYRTDHYNTVDNPVLFLFEQAEIRISADDTGTSLAGNIRMYSPQSMEPERPMYLSLRKANAEVAPVTPIDALRAYPVPFSNELNVSFMQAEEEAVRIGIYNQSGACVYLYDAGRLPVGEQHLTLGPSLPAGTYIVKLFAGKRSSQVIVVSNGNKP